jgi:peptide/nickel transport system substrate-binding protein
MKKSFRLLIIALASTLAVAAVAAACTREVEVPGETVVVEKEVIREVEVPGETVVVEKEVIREVEVPGETVVVEKEVVKLVHRAPEPSTDPVYGGTLRVTSQGSIASMDMIWTGAMVTIAPGIHMYETLFGWDEDIVIQPRMVSTWDLSDDQTKYTFTLRDGLKFHNDGSPVGPGDAIASIKRTGERAASMQLLFEFVAEDGFEIIDDKTFTMQLTEPWDALTAFSYPWGSGLVMPEEISSTTPGSESVETDEFIGSGPYQIGSWEPGHKLTLTRFDDYVPRGEDGSYVSGAQIAYLDNIEWLEIPDEETKIAGLETGEWDVVDGAGLDFYKRLNENPDVIIPIYSQHRTNVGFNVSRPPFNNEPDAFTSKARLAVQAGLDINELGAVLGDPALWSLCPAIFFCGTPLESDASAELYNENDLAKAQRLLGESGYADEVVTLMNPTDYATITPVGIAYKKQLEDIGFNVEMPAMDWSAVVSNFGNSEAFNTYASWGIQWGNAGDPLREFNIGGGNTIRNFLNPTMLDLRIKFGKATTLAEKKMIVDDIQHEWYRTAPVVYLNQWSSIYPYRSWLQGFDFAHITLYVNTWLDR